MTAPSIPLDPGEQVVGARQRVLCAARDGVQGKGCTGRNGGSGHPVTNPSIKKPLPSHRLVVAIATHLSAAMLRSEFACEVQSQPDVLAQDHPESTAVARGSHSLSPYTAATESSGRVKKTQVQVWRQRAHKNGMKEAGFSALKANKLEVPLGVPPSPGAPEVSGPRLCKGCSWWA